MEPRPCGLNASLRVVVVAAEPQYPAATRLYSVVGDFVWAMRSFQSAASFKVGGEILGSF